jgi:hypothetical protein
MTSQLLPFNVVAAKGSDDFCFDYKTTCLELADGDVLTDAVAAAGGNTGATADADIELWVEAFCHLCAEAYARACAFYSVTGNVRVQITQPPNALKSVHLFVDLQTATATYALADTRADALAYAEAGATSFTDVAVVCNSPNPSPLCAGLAGTRLTQIAIASAGSFASASSVAQSGAFAGSNASVSVQGTSINSVIGVVAAYARSWSFSDASAAAVAFAQALASVSSESFSEICIENCKKICSTEPSNPVCSDPNVACASAYAAGSGFAVALAEAVASAFVSSCAEADACVYLSAEVDTSSSAKVFFSSQATGDAEINLQCSA